MHESSTVGKDERRSLREVIEAVVKALPVEYPKRRAELARLNDEFREHLARALEPSLNAELSLLPQASYEDKKTLAKWVNAELRQIGLAIRCPKTGKPCHILANKGHDPVRGRFQLEYTDIDGQRRRTVSSAELPALALMPDDPSRAEYGERKIRER